jgi:4-amino-4-deoxy-L-arabinose transferase-like glycosyltransferase
MLIIIPFLVFVFIYLIFYIKLGGGNVLSAWRVSYLSASVICGVLVVVITEILSIFDLITFNWVVGFWIAIGISSASFCSILVIKKRPSIHFILPKFQLFEVVLLLGVVFIVMVLCFIALVSPPNSYDSMTYHMSRLCHWIQNHNVAHYPTHILRQLYMQPFAEFSIMHLQILSGGDRFANLVQWFSMIGSLIGVSLIAKQLGADLSGQILSVIVCSTIPMGILQASSTLNDYVVSFWLVCFVYFLMLLRTQPKGIYSLATGISLGLTLLTKATAYIYASPFILWFIFSGFKRLRWKLWKPILVIAILVFLINLGHSVRNFDLYGHPLGGPEEFKNVSNNAMSIPLLMSNIIRNMGLHIGTPGWVVNAIMLKAVKSLHAMLGVSILDPYTTYRLSTSFFITFSTDETYAGNLIHFILILGSIIIFFVSWQRRNSRDLMRYNIVLIAAFLLFAFYLKCQPWGSRLHLPLFVLWSPFMAIVFSRINSFKGKKILLIFMGIMLMCVLIGWFLYDYFIFKFVETNYKGLTTNGNFNFYLKVNICLLLGLLLLYRYNLRVSHVIGLILILTSAPWVFHNSYKNLIGEENIFNTGRTDQYFLAMPNFKDPYIKVVDYLKSKGYSDIGVMLSENSWEYPLFVFFKENNTHALRIEHVNVNNLSSTKYKIPPFNDFNPYVIISTRSLQNDKILYKDAIYVKERVFYPVCVFIRR